MADNTSATPAATSSPVPSPADSAAQSSNPATAVQNLQQQAVTGTPTQKAEAQKMLKSLKIKVDGKELDEALPFEIPDTEESREYMTRQLQMGRMGQKRAQEYSQLEKEVRGFVELLRKDPKRALQDPAIGLDIKQLAASIIEEEIANSQKSPELLRAEKSEKELEEYKKKQKEEKEEYEAKEFERIQEAEYERYDMEMTSALEKADIPKSAYYISRMANYMAMGLKEGLDVRPQDVLPVVKQEFEDDIREALSKMPEEAIEKMIGKDVFNRIRKKNIAKVKQAPATKVNDVAKTSEKKEIPVQKQSFKQFFGV